MIVPIVEGHGEEQSVPALIRRVLHDRQVFHVSVRRGLRVPRNRLPKQGELERYVRYARQMLGARAVALAVDADEDCPKTLAPQLVARGASEMEGGRMSVVLAKVELEAWFVAGIESLRGIRGVREDAMTPADPESIRDAKGWLTRNMSAGRTYVPVDDQPALAAQFDYAQAARSSRSLRKFLKDIEEIVRTI